jgi:hypothetical protein
MMQITEFQFNSLFCSSPRHLRRRLCHRCRRRACDAVYLSSFRLGRIVASGFGVVPSSRSAAAELPALGGRSCVAAPWALPGYSAILLLSRLARAAQQLFVIFTLFLTLLNVIVGCYVPHGRHFSIASCLICVYFKTHKIIAELKQICDISLI